MIIERRAYTFRPGAIPAFWQAQVDWNLGDTFAPVLSRNLSYFEVISGTAEQVIHLYAFPSLDAWDAAYREVYARHPNEYFVLARRLILAQETAFYRPAPVPDLALGPTGFRAPSAPGDLLVSEVTTHLLPGSLPAFWRAYADYCHEEPELARSNLMALLYVLVGPLHSVREYRWHADQAAYDNGVSARRGSAAYGRFLDAHRDLVVSADTTLMRPSALPSHRAMFERPGPTEAPDVDR